MKNTSTIASSLVKTLSGIADLSSLLFVSEESLRHAIKHAPRQYREISIEKSDGDRRTINAPSDKLKTIQRAILDSILIWEPITECAYGFSKGRGIVDNARLHVANDYMLNADIVGFFPSVHFKRIYNLFFCLGSSEFIARTLTGLTTLNHCLPQGAPTSPYLATLALSNLDERVEKLCAANRLTYSRYFDDITISGGKRTHEIFETLEAITASEGYKLHTDPAKLRLYGPRDEKLVTGIVIKSGELCVPNIVELSGYICALQNRGVTALRGDNPLKEKTSLQGKIAFVSQVNSDLGEVLVKEFNAIIW